MADSRRVSLRAEHNGDDHRYLDAHLEQNGDLRISGQDIGPGTAPISDDGEYEWEEVITREHIPALLTLLGAPADSDILDELVARCSGSDAYEFERRLRNSDIPFQFWSYP